MCSTPRGSGLNCKVHRVREHTPDYERYASMLRRASAAADRREADTETKSKKHKVSRERIQLPRPSLFKRLIYQLFY